MSQYGGPGRPTGSGDYGGGGSGQGGDDDRYTAPFSEQGGGQDSYDSERTPFGYQPEERYWTDYLRIAAPVVGVILMLGLVWFWVAQMLGDDNDDVTNDDTDTSGPVIPADTPEATVNGEDDETDDAIAVTTPGPDDDADPENGENGDGPTTIGPGASVVVVGTGEAGLNVRSSASTDAEVVTSFPDGTILTITGESQEAGGFVWWPIEAEGTTGFVVENFIELSQ